MEQNSPVNLTSYSQSNAWQCSLMVTFGTAGGCLFGSTSSQRSGAKNSVETVCVTRGIFAAYDPVGGTLFVFGSTMWFGTLRNVSAGLNVRCASVKPPERVGAACHAGKFSLITVFHSIESLLILAPKSDALSSVLARTLACRRQLFELYRFLHPKKPRSEESPK
jgi:hypothetical protein